jgi:hypothetical protein
MGLENALVTENLRLCCKNGDYLSLKDALKLGLRFKASLPIDKVYALIGIIAERDTPPVHPTFSTSEAPKPTNESTRIVYSFKEALNLVDNMGQLLGTVMESKNTRIGHKMTSSPDLAIRNLVRIQKALVKTIDSLDHAGGGASELDSKPIRPDYSEITVTSVYIYVARDLVRQGDNFSFLYRAGIGLSRKLKGLPS